MKNSYPDSLICVSSALTMASSLRKKSSESKNDNKVADTHWKESKFLKFNFKVAGLGTKFDNILAGKYFALINRTQRHTVVKMKGG